MSGSLPRTCPDVSLQQETPRRGLLRRAVAHAACRQPGAPGSARPTHAGRCAAGSCPRGPPGDWVADRGRRGERRPLGRSRRGATDTGTPHRPPRVADGDAHLRACARCSADRGGAHRPGGRRCPGDGHLQRGRRPDAAAGLGGDAGGVGQACAAARAHRGLQPGVSDPGDRPDHRPIADRGTGRRRRRCCADHSRGDQWPGDDRIRCTRNHRGSARPRSDGGTSQPRRGDAGR